MKTLVSLLTLTVATSAFASTDYDRFAKAVSKYATKLGGQPKGLCLCREESLSRSVGYLLLGASEPIGTTGFITSAVGCHVPGFDENGGQGVTFVCMDFVPLVK